jgi:hypothetical protein
MAPLYLKAIFTGVTILQGLQPFRVHTQPKYQLSASSTLVPNRIRASRAKKLSPISKRKTTKLTMINSQHYIHSASSSQ